MLSFCRQRQIICNAKSAVHEVGYISLEQAVLQTANLVLFCRGGGGGGGGGGWGRVPDCDLSTLFSQGVCVC